MIVKMHVKLMRLEESLLQRQKLTELERITSSRHFGTDSVPYAVVTTDDANSMDSTFRFT
jgi:hypothetical protein